MSSTCVKLSGVFEDRVHNIVSGWAMGSNGWKFEFSVSPGVIDLDTRDQTDYAAKADARQIRRELKKCFLHIFNASKVGIREDA